MFPITIQYPMSHLGLQERIKEIVISNMSQAIASARGNAKVLQELREAVCQARNLISELQFEITHPELARRPRNII